jgi:hypothetical protein
VVLFFSKTGLEFMNVILPNEKHAIVKNIRLYVCILGNLIPIRLKPDKKTKNPHHEITIEVGFKILSDFNQEKSIEKKTIESNI